MTRRDETTDELVTLCALAVVAAIGIAGVVLRALRDRLRGKDTR